MWLKEFSIYFHDFGNIKKFPNHANGKNNEQGPFSISVSERA